MTQKVWLVVVVAVLVGAAGFGVCGQTFTGSWNFDAYFSQTASLTIESTVTMDYTVGDWVFTSESLFDMSSGFAEQDFFVVGTLGAFSITGGAVFSPVLATYEYSWFSAFVSIAGVDLTFTVDHFLWPFGFTVWPCQTPAGSS